MANALTQQPLFLDTDQTVAYKSEPTVTAINPSPLGVQVVNILVTCPGGTPTAGTITVTDGDASGSINLLTIHITTLQLFPIALEYTVPLQWRNFKITGLTATATAMQIWTR